MSSKIPQKIMNTVIVPPASRDRPYLHNIRPMSLILYYQSDLLLHEKDHSVINSCVKKNK